MLTDTASIFIGFRAGYDSDNIDNSIFMGTNAGNNADTASDSIFIGSSAGLDSNCKNSIGIGENALRRSGDNGGGKGNIEIVTNLLDVQRLMYGYDNLDGRLNIQNCIAGRTISSDGNTNYSLVSIGDATFSPDAPLSVRRDTLKEGHSTASGIQTWYNNDLLQSYIQPSGDYILDSGSTPAWFGNFEGFMVDYIYAPDDYANEKTGYMRVKGPDFLNGELVLVTHRDAQLDIHGEGASNGPAFVVTNRVNGENRPIYVSCSG